MCKVQYPPQNQLLILEKFKVIEITLVFILCCSVNLLTTVCLTYTVDAFEAFQFQYLRSSSRSLTSNSIKRQNLVFDIDCARPSCHVYKVRWNQNTNSYSRDKQLKQDQNLFPMESDISPNNLNVNYHDKNNGKINVIPSDSSLFPVGSYPFQHRQAPIEPPTPMTTAPPIPMATAPPIPMATAPPIPMATTPPTPMAPATPATPITMVPQFPMLTFPTFPSPTAMVPGPLSTAMAMAPAPPASPASPAATPSDFFSLLFDKEHGILTRYSSWMPILIMLIGGPILLTIIGLLVIHAVVSHIIKSELTNRLADAEDIIYKINRVSSGYSRRPKFGLGLGGGGHHHHQMGLDNFDDDYSYGNYFKKRHQKLINELDYREDDLRLGGLGSGDNLQFTSNWMLNFVYGIISTGIKSYTG